MKRSVERGRPTTTKPETKGFDWWETGRKGVEEW